MIENVLHLVEAAAEPQSAQVDPGTSFHSWCHYHIPSEGDGKSLTINVRGVPLKIISSDQRYYNLEVLAPNNSALRFTGYDKNNGPYIAVELAKSRTRNEAARIATAPDSIVHDATNVQEFLKALFSIKSRGASILNRLVSPGAAHAAAEPDLPIRPGDAFAKLWLEFMPREKTITVQGTRVVLESMDSIPCSIEAKLPGAVYSLCQSLGNDYWYQIDRVGGRRNIGQVQGKLQPRAMLSQFLQIVVRDWKQDQATAAAEPELPMQVGDSFAKLWLEFTPKAKTVTVQGIPVVLQSYDGDPDSIEATLPGGVTYCLEEDTRRAIQYRVTWFGIGRRRELPLISGNLKPQVMLSQFLQLSLRDWKQHQATASAEPRPARDLFLELQRYAGKLVCKNTETKNKVVLNRVTEERDNLQLQFTIYTRMYDYNASNTGSSFIRTVETKQRISVPTHGHAGPSATVNVAGRQLSLTEDATTLAKKVVVLISRGLLSEANLKTRKTIPPVHDHPSDRTSQASAEPELEPGLSGFARLHAEFLRMCKRKPTMKVGTGKIVLDGVDFVGKDVHNTNIFTPVVKVYFRCFNHTGTYCGRHCFAVADVGDGFSVHQDDFKHTRIGTGKNVNAVLQIMLKSFQGLTIASAEPVPDTLQAIAHTLESWVGRVYSRAGAYVAGIQSARMDTRGGATFPQREVLMVVTSVQRGREILGTTPHHVVQDPKTREIVVLANPGAAKPEPIGRARITDPTQAARWILHTIAAKSDPLRSWR